jgi:predicted PurR-regulated permease PerM
MRDHRLSASSLSRALLRVLVIVTVAAAGAWTLHRLSSLVLILILSGLFAYVIAPLVDALSSPIRLGAQARHLPRGVAIALVYLILAGGLTLGTAVVLPRAVDQASEVLAHAPMYTQSFVAWERGWSRYYERLRIPVPMRQGIDQSVRSGGEAALRSGRASLLALLVTLSALPWLALIPVLAFFLLKDAGVMRRAALSALPHAYRLRGHQLFKDLNAILAAYIRAQLLACALVGVLCGVGFAVIGVPYPALLGLAAGALEFIPLVGPLVLAIAAATIAALHSPILGLYAIGFLGVLRVVEDYVIYPRLIQRGVELHPLAVILAVVAGGELGGIAGVFLAVPAAAVVSVVGRHWLDWRHRDAAEDGLLTSRSARSASVPFGTR